MMTMTTMMTVCIFRFFTEQHIFNFSLQEMFLFSWVTLSCCVCLNKLLIIRPKKTHTDLLYKSFIINYNMFWLSRSTIMKWMLDKQ